MTADERLEAAVLRQRLRAAFSVFRSVADHMGAQRGDADDARLELSGRIGAIARVALATAVDGVDLEGLVLDELLLHAVSAEQARVRGADVRLPLNSAELMSLAIHELATNAVKFGALAQTAGHIDISWQLIYHSGASRLRFEWLETGVELGPAGANLPGFGLQLVERIIASRLKGEGKVAMLRGGVRCTIEIPLEHATST